jgi:hypothetical protein
MSDLLEPVRKAFEEARGPFRKRQAINHELKEPDVGKGRRTQLVKEAAEMDEQWKAALVDLYKAMIECPPFMEAVKKE